jgi:UrcA family protein
VFTNLVQEIVMKSTIKTRFTSMPSLIAASVIALACAASGSRAQASDTNQPLTKTVAYGDLNLDAAGGAKALYTRLRYAAEDVCSPFEAKELSRQRIWQRCVDSALARAVEQINKPMVTALHDRRANGVSAG